MSPTVLPPGFRRTALLGRGGTAEVVRAHSDKLGRDVALKLPLDGEPGSPDSTLFAALAQRELSLIGRSRFPGLVRLLQVSLTPPWIAMEICPGPTLDSLGRVDRLPLALNLLSALALDLEYLRASGLVHGDLKPQNVFLPASLAQISDTDLFWLKLSDFSLGLRRGEPISARAGLGTVGYLAPETIIDGTLDHSSDLFAFGVIAYTVLTGVHPFLNGDTDPAVVNSRCREEEPPDVRSLRPDIDPALSDLVSRLLSKQSAQRPRSAWAVCLELERLGASYPFRRAMSAAQFIPRGAAWEDLPTVLPLEWDRHREYLEDISLRRVDSLRLVLTANTRRGNLIYNDGRFLFLNRPYWPTTLRRRCLKTFAQSSPHRRREIIRAVVLGSAAYLTHPEDRCLSLLLPPLLRPATIRRISASGASAAEAREDHVAATRLALQAGDLTRAERCCYQAATALIADHQFRPALRLIDSAIDYAALIHRLFDTALLIKMKGDTLRNTGDSDGALAQYRLLLSLYEDRHFDILIGKTYNAIGDLFKMKQRYTEGIEALRKALEIYEATGNELELSHTYNNIGNMYFIAGNRPEALRQYRRALHIQRRLKAEAEIASTLNNLGGVLAMTGRFDRAVRVLSLTLNLKRSLGDIGEIARTLNNLGYLHSMLGRKDTAIASLSESLELNRRIGNQKEILFNLDNLAAVIIGAGRLKDSLPLLREGLGISRELRDTPHQVIFGRNLSVVLRRMGRIGEAVEQQNAAEKMMSGVDDREEEIRLLVNAASLRAVVGDNSGALQFARSAADSAAAINCAPEKLNALLLITRLCDQPEPFGEAASLCRQLGLERERLLLDMNRLEASVRSGRLNSTDSDLDAFETRILALEPDLELPRLLNIAAETRLLLGQVDSAHDLIRKALGVAEQSGLAPEKALALTLHGRILHDQGLFEEAFAACRTALALLKAIAESVSSADDRASLQRTPVFTMLVAEITRIQKRLGQKKEADLRSASQNK